MLNVRRLMYQPLIRAGRLRHHAGGLRSPIHPEDMERSAHALVNGVRRNPELLGDFLGRQMLVDQLQACELSTA